MSIIDTLRWIKSRMTPLIALSHRPMMKCRQREALSLEVTSHCVIVWLKSTDSLLLLEDKMVAELQAMCNISHFSQHSFPQTCSKWTDQHTMCNFKFALPKHYSVVIFNYPSEKSNINQHIFHAGSGWFMLVSAGIVLVQVDLGWSSWWTNIFMLFSSKMGLSVSRPACLSYCLVIFLYLTLMTWRTTKM